MEMVYSKMTTALLLFGISMLALTACKDDDTPSCTQCNSENTIPFEVCREGNGNASVNGEDTGTNYDVYISGLEDAGASCGR